MNIQKMTGIIAGASPVKRFTKKNGNVSESAVLHIVVNCNHSHPQEVAVKVTGDYVNYAQCVGMTVEVEYICRVFPFIEKGTGYQSFGNDLYLHSITIVNKDRSAMLDE